MTAEGLTVARVLCDASGPDRAFDYLVPASLADRVDVGAIVRIDLHGRRLGGWVVALNPGDSPQHLVALRSMSGIGPASDVVSLTEWAAHRWAGRRSIFLRAASPPRVVRAVGAARWTGLCPEPRSPATSRLLTAGGGVLRLPPATDVVPSIWSAVALGPTLVVMPGVDDVAILAGRLRRGGVSVAVLPDEWERARNGVDVTIGTRTAVFASVPNLAAIVVLDEHDDRLQSESSPTWHAREVALERGRSAGLPVLLVSPVPSPEARLGRVLEAPPRAREVNGWPHIDVVDPSDHDGPTAGRVSSALLAEIRNEDRRVLCVLNTSGRSALLACRSCRSLARCERCEATLVQMSDGTLHCRRCGSDRPAVCAACSAASFINLRRGTAGFARELGAATTRPIVLLEGDDAVPWGSGRDDVAVVIGTEAVLHRVHHADTVVFLDIDAELFAPRFRAGQYVASLFARAARIIGDRRGGGRIIVQTTRVDHPTLVAFAAADPGAAGDRETSARRDMALPPFGAMAVIEGAGAHEFVASLPDTVAVGGDGDRWQVRAASWEVLSDALEQGQRPTRSRLRVAVDPAR